LDLALNYLPRLPRRKDFGIGCLGAGFIMRECHLVAYRQAGFHPVAIASRNPEHARSVAALHGIPRTHATIEALLQDKAVEVLDTIEMRAIPHWMPWSEKLPSLATFVMSIHHLDTFRYWFGTPDRVLASTRPDPRTRFSHTDGINLYILEYDQGCRATSWDDVWTGPTREGSQGDIYIRWRVEGTDGLARGTIGWPSYPAKTPSTLDFTTKQQPGYWLQPRWPEVWFPDAFVGTMAQLLCALEDGTEPGSSGRDNLETNP